MPDSNNNWYEQASASLRKFFEFAGGKNLPGAPDAPTRNPFGGGGLAPAPRQSKFNWWGLFSPDSKDSPAKRYLNQTLMKIQGQRSLAVSQGKTAEVKRLDAEMKRIREEGPELFSARRMRENAELGK